MDNKSWAPIRSYLSSKTQRVEVGDTFLTSESVKHRITQGSVLGPMLLNIFINHFFFHVKRAKLNAYADDHQVHYSHVDPAALEACASHDVGVANQWYHENGKLREQAPESSPRWSGLWFFLPVKDTLKTFGMEIDNKLNFSEHISNVCKNINN